MKRVPCQLIRSGVHSRTEPFVVVGTRDNDGTPEMITMIVLMVAAVIYYTERSLRPDCIAYYYYPCALCYLLETMEEFIAGDIDKII